MWLPVVIVILTWASRSTPAPRYAVKRIIMPDYYDPSPCGLTRAALDRSPRDYLPLRLTGDPDTDNILFAYAQIRLAEIKRTHDTLHGVKFFWSDSVTYGTVISALDVPEIEDVKVYMLYADSLWMFNKDNGADSTRLIVPRPID